MLKLAKLQLRKKYRIGLLVVFVLLFLGSLYNLYYLYFLRAPEIREEVPVYGYEQEARIDYSVKIKENDFFQDTVLPAEKTYFTKLVEGIDANSSYILNVDRPSFLKVAYSIIATVDAPEMWHKDFVLVPKTEVSKNNETVISFNMPYQINLAYFHDYLKSVNEELGVSARDPKLVVKSVIDFEAVSEAGTLKEQINPYMAIPLTAGNFQISGELAPKKEGSLKEAQLVPDPTLQVERKWGIVPSVVLALVCLLFPVLTINKQEEIDKEGERIAKTLITCEDRLVRVGENFCIPKNNIVIELFTVEDLIKVADELSKPILFHHVKSNFPAYYIIDGFTTYKYLFPYQTQSEQQPNSLNVCLAPSTRLKNFKSEASNLAEVKANN